MLPASAITTGPHAFNDDAEGDLRLALHRCCASESWVAGILAGRPYASRRALLEASDRLTAALNDNGLAQALAGHPRIGDIADAADTASATPATPATPAADSAYAATDAAHAAAAAWVRGEQALVAEAGIDLKAQLAAANTAYERRFGHIYLVCATGRTARELLEICLGRLANDPQTERGVLLAELAKINCLRLEKLLEEMR